MKKKRTPFKPDDAKQSQRFVETAKKLDVDESGEAFSRTFKSVVKPKQRRLSKSGGGQ